MSTPEENLAAIKSTMEATVLTMAAATAAIDRLRLQVQYFKKHYNEAKARATYPEFCKHPGRCAGAGRCMAEWVCND
jgi:hypothetical protein